MLRIVFIIIIPSDRVSATDVPGVLFIHNVRRSNILQLLVRRVKRQRSISNSDGLYDGWNDEWKVCVRHPCSADNLLKQWELLCPSLL